MPPAPVAVKFVMPPKSTVAEAGLATGAFGELLIVINCAPEKVWPFFTTAITPEVPAPATPVIVVFETMTKEATAVPPIVTALTPVKLVPVIVNVPEFEQSVSGATLETVGAVEAHAK